MSLTGLAAPLPWLPPVLGTETDSVVNTTCACAGTAPPAMTAQATPAVNRHRNQDRTRGQGVVLTGIEKKNRIAPARCCRGVRVCENEIHCFLRHLAEFSSVLSSRKNTLMLSRYATFVPNTENYQKVWPAIWKEDDLPGKTGQNPRLTRHDHGIDRDCPPNGVGRSCPRCAYCRTFLLRSPNSLARLHFHLQAGNKRWSQLVSRNIFGRYR